MADESRPVVYIGRWSWFGGQASALCAFASREEAIKWAKDSVRFYIDWATWTAPQGEYPDETARDDEHLDPTFYASWEKEGGGWVSVAKTYINDTYDWGAKR